MTAFRFIHSSDLHLGRRFGNLPEDARGRLVEARHASIGKLASAARDNDASHILLAGDVFDTETPSDPIWRQAITAMGAAKEIHWWIIPGNHDSLAAEALWDRVREHAPDNIRVIDNASPEEISPKVTLLPAPVTRRYPGRDLTEWMVGCITPEDHIRIGLAHGGVVTFGSEDEGSEIIPPDRATSAHLDYLALGDWHGMKKIGDRTYYSGTPESDRFKHSGRGVCLAVTINAPRTVPEVEVIETSLFEWSDKQLSLTPEQDPVATLNGALPGEADARRDVLVRIQAEGWLRLPERLALSKAVEAVQPEFWHFEFDDSALNTEYSANDLDEIATGGALRLAADALYADTEDNAASGADRNIAAAALRRLYGYVKGEQQ